jgi:CubicO group peptidase (beta-lactamase class C family)
MLTACSPTMNEAMPDRSERVRTYLDGLLASNRAPGIQYLVIDSSRTIFEYAAGWADIAGRVPMDTSTSMMGYSMSKTITAAAVLQLVEKGQIGLEDPVDRYVKEIPYGSSITVRQLISHTSGVPNPVPLRWVHLANQHETFNESSALMTQLERNPRLSFSAGSRYRYSNIGYWLLGSITERVSSQTFTSYVEEHVFRPLGAGPGELGYQVADPNHHAVGYLEKYSFLNLVKTFLIDRALVGKYEGRWLQLQSHYANGPAFGGVIGNARGFGKFLQDQLRERSVLLGDQARTLFYETQRTNNGRPVAMTLGWHIGELNGVPFYYKEGGGGGFHAMMRIYPSAGKATVIMTNATGFDVKACLNVIDRQFLD